MRFRKKPVEITAVRWNETITTLKVLEGMGMRASYIGHLDRPDECKQLRISTLEGTMSADLGDWIICGVKGEFYPCKPGIFELTYEPVEVP